MIYVARNGGVMDLEYDEISAIESTLAKAQTVSRMLHRVFSAVFWFGTVSYVIILISMVINGVSNYYDTGIASFFVAFLKVALEFLLVLFAIRIMTNSFQDLAMGKSPFTRSQSTRLRIMAVVLLVHALLTTVLSPAILGIAGLDGAVVGLATGSAPVEAAARIIPINVGDIVLAVVLFCAALIVEYGSLLQQLSDDTL